MFVVFLPALNFRGNRSPYLWWFHKFLSAFKEQAAYIAGEEYFRDPAQLFAEGRLEANPELARRYQYHLPDQAILNEQLRADIPLHYWQTIEALFPTNPLAALRYFCLNNDNSLRTAIENSLDELTKQRGAPEVIISCVNCASLQNLCRDRNLRLLHIELGPLREPHFLQTAYFDFSGVNGGTESQCRYTKVSDSMASGNWNNVRELCSLFMMQRLPICISAEVDLGLGLQIEDDSNLVCYSHGHTALSLINHARQSLSQGQITPTVLVRSHPNSYFSLRSAPPGLEIDHSETSAEFILRCKRVDTINSGVAVESLLLGRAVRVLGDSPFSFCIDPEQGLCNETALSFFLLNYLVPWDLAFKPEYIRWRLCNPIESKIRKFHLEIFMQEKIRLLEIRIAELEQTLVENERQWAQLRDSLVWRLFHPIWKMMRLLHQRLRGRRN